MKKAIFITVRTGSTRLPNKSLLKINGKHTIEYVINASKKSKYADVIILCTTNNESDDVLCEIAKNNGIQYFRGSEKDKLERWNQACKKFNIDFFITADGDDLFCTPELIDLGFKQYLDDQSIDFIKSDEVICGTFTYGIKSSALKKVCQIKNTDETEMMWVYFTDTGLFNVECLKNINPLFCRDDIRMTLDYIEDFIFFKNIIENFKNIDYNLVDIIGYIDLNPDVKKINFHRHQEWRKNQINKTKMEIK